MTKDERSEKWIGELDEIDRMSPDELRAEARKLADEPTLAGFIAKLACIRDAKARHEMELRAKRIRRGRDDTRRNRNEALFLAIRRC